MTADLLSWVGDSQVGETQARSSAAEDVYTFPLWRLACEVREGHSASHRIRPPSSCDVAAVQAGTPVQMTGDGDAHRLASAVQISEGNLDAIAMVVRGDAILDTDIHQSVSRMVWLNVDPILGSSAIGICELATLNQQVLSGDDAHALATVVVAGHVLDQDVLAVVVGAPFTNVEPVAT